MAKKTRSIKPVDTTISEEGKAKIKQQDREDPRKLDGPVSQQQWDEFFRMGSWDKLDPQPKGKNDRGYSDRTIIDAPDC